MAWIKQGGREPSDNIYLPKETIQARFRRSAKARALSLAVLLGLPAQTHAGVACGRRIVGTGCGKEMVSDTTFIESVLQANLNRANESIVHANRNWDCYFG